MVHIGPEERPSFDRLWSEATMGRSTKSQFAVAGSLPNLSQNPTPSGVEARRARIAEGPEAVLQQFRWPNVVAIEGDMLPAERRDMSNEIVEPASG